MDPGMGHNCMALPLNVARERGVFHTCDHAWPVCSALWCGGVDVKQAVSTGSSEPLIYICR